MRPCYECLLCNSDTLLYVLLRSAVNLLSPQNYCFLGFPKCSGFKKNAHLKCRQILITSILNKCHGKLSTMYNKYCLGYQCVNPNLKIVYTFIILF